MDLRKSKPFAAVSALVTKGLDNAAEGEVFEDFGQSQRAFEAAAQICASD